MLDHLRSLVVAALLMAPAFASANVATTTGSLALGTVDHFGFDVSDSGHFDLSLTSNSFDTELFLFPTSVSNSGFLANADSNGSSSSIIDRYLTIGHPGAANGAVPDISAPSTAGTVSDSGAMGLIGAGLVALTLMRRRGASI